MEHLRAQSSSMVGNLLRIVSRRPQYPSASYRTVRRSGLVGMALRPEAYVSWS